MKKLNVIIVVLAMIFVSCKNDQKQTEKGGEPHHAEHKEGDRKGPPHDGDHKGPPKGDHKGGPKGSPEQTKTLEEIGGYKIGDVATDFSLKNTDGEMVSLASFTDAKGYVVVFTCNECPFAKMYEDRLNTLNDTYAPKGYPVIAINPNSVEGNEKEGYEAMQARAEEKGFTFPYLVDARQEIFPQYGAVRTPHVFLLDSEFKVQYIGTIDDNAKDAEAVKVTYLEDAIAALEKGETPAVNFTKAIGCPIKVSK